VKLSVAALALLAAGCTKTADKIFESLAAVRRRTLDSGP